MLQLTYIELVAATKYCVYLPACILCAWLLLPRLSTFSRRVAGAALLIKLLLLLLSMELASERSFGGFVWNYDIEHTIASQLGATLMSFAGALALLAAWRARGSSNWRRAHWLMVGVLLLMLAIDDYYYPLKSISQPYPDRYYSAFYAAIGAVIGAATLLAFARSAGRMRLWHGCLLAGCALMGLGAILLDNSGELCGLPLLVKIVGGCQDPTHLEELAEQMGSWLALAAALGYLDSALPKPSRRLRRALIALPLLWFPIILMMSQIPRLEVAALPQRTDTRFGHGIQLLGYDIQRGEGEIALRFYLSASQAGYVQLANNFMEMVDGVTGASLAKTQFHASNEQGAWFLGAHARLIYRQRLRLPLPADLPVNRALSITLAMSDRANLMPIESSDRRLLGQTHVVLDEFVIPAPQPAGDAAPLAIFDDRFALLDVQLPARTSPGAALDIPIAWRSESDSQTDYTQFLHFAHADTGAQWGFDQPPLGNRLPTRLWYAGLQDSEIWRFAAPAGIAPGQYDVYTGLYNPQTMRRLPVMDAAGNPLPDARVRVGSLRVGA